MRLLVLGGSVFLGRAVVDAAVAAGHDVTTFNRGMSGPDHPRAAAIRGNRSDPDDLRRLAEVEPWDAVLDTSPQVPRDVVASAEALSGVHRYVLVTSVSVYPGWPAERVGSSSVTFPCAPDAGSDLSLIHISEPTRPY
jgi:2'-hydroxyisoflavone reductase